MEVVVVRVIIDSIVPTPIGSLSRAAEAAVAAATASLALVSSTIGLV